MEWGYHVQRTGDEKFWAENLKERQDLGYPSVDKATMLKRTLRKQCEGAKWIQPTERWVQWRVTVNTITNFVFRNRRRIC